MSDFEKYWEENASKESWANKAVAWNIWKEKQAKVDELQNRINEALEDLEYPAAPWDETIASVVKVLRGEE